MGKRIACIGDIHGDLANLTRLYSMLEYESLDDIYHLGDIIDRGPDTAGVLSFCIEKGILGLLGNHEYGLFKHIDNSAPPKSPDKLKSYNAILSVNGALAYLKSLPKIVVIEELKSILVHAGVDPFKTLAQQNTMCSYVAMVNPNQPGMSRWWNTDKKGRTEEMNRLEGWRRWYEDYDLPYDVYHGHMVVSKPWVEPFVRQPAYKRIAIDTGAWFTGELTAAIISSPGGPEKFVSTPRLRDGNYAENESNP